MTIQAFYFVILLSYSLVATTGDACCQPGVGVSLAPGELGAHAATSKVQDDTFGTDPRFDKRLTLRREAVTIAAALKEISLSTGIRVRPDASIDSRARISLHYKSRTVRDVLDSIAAIRDWEWHRDNDRWLVLRKKYNPHRNDMRRPHTVAEAEIYRQGRQFIEHLRNQPEDFQKAIQTHHSLSRRPNGVSFGDLPLEMQQNLQAMLAAKIEDAAEKGQGIPPASLNNLDETRVWMDVFSNEDSADYRVMIQNRREGQDITFSLFRDAKEGYPIVPQSEVKSAAWYGEQEDEASRKEALKKDTRLNTRISLHLTQATFLEALRAIARKVEIDFASDCYERTPIRSSLSYRNLTLGEVLDQLVELYRFRHGSSLRGRTWGWRQSGIFQFHIAPPQRQRTATGQSK